MVYATDRIRIVVKELAGVILLKMDIIMNSPKPRVHFYIMSSRPDYQLNI